MFYRCFSGKGRTLWQGDTFFPGINTAKHPDWHSAQARNFGPLSPVWPLGNLKICLHLFTGGWYHLYCLLQIANLMLFGLSLPMHKRFMAGCSHPDVLILFLYPKTLINPSCLLYFFITNARREKSWQWGKYSWHIELLYAEPQMEPGLEYIIIIHCPKVKVEANFEVWA